MLKAFDNNRGLTLIELIVTMVILSILAAAVIPSMQLAARRNKEIELKRDLREIRGALDDYKKYYDKAVQQGSIPQEVDASGYPKTLQVLVDGYDFGGMINYQKKFLRRIPIDPFHPVTGKDEDRWRLRSYKDSPDSSSWGGEDVFDVTSLSDDTAIDGTKYKDW